MNRSSKVIIVVLTLALVGSNAWWMYHALDQAVTMGYTDQMLWEYRNQVALLKGVCLDLEEGSTKEDVLHALGRVDPGLEPFEKDGLLNTGLLSFRFDGDGGLVEVLTADDFQGQVE